MLKTTRFCSFILVLAMIFNLLPIQALGTVKETIPTVQTSDEASLSAAGSAQQAVEPAVIVEELTESRTEYSKSYRLSNGLNMAVVYNEPVHYDDGGNWAEIDNTLVADTKGGYTNTAGVWDVVLPQTSGSPVTVTKDGYSLSFVLAGQLTAPSGTAVKAAGKTELTTAKTVTAVPKDTGVAAAKAEAAYPETVSDKLRAGLMYADVFTGTSVTYDLNSNKLKESVILEAYNANLRGYKYTLSTDGLVPVLNEDGQIDLYNTEKTEVVLTMPAPFLVDAANEYNYDIQVKLTGSGSTYTLTYLLPQSWLAEESRQWPVILDPVVQPTLSISNISDCEVAENAGTNRRLWATMTAGRDATDGKKQIYLKYNELPELNPSDVVVEADIQLRVYNSSYLTSLEVHKVLGTWESETISWTNKPAYDPIVEDYGATVSNTLWDRWVITDLVRGWYEGENTGMMFKADDGVENGNSEIWRQYCSADSAWYPALSIKFRNNNGLESYWDYTSASAGRAGTGSVNTYTGNLVWTRSDIGFGGNRAPVAISHVYNANDTVVTTTSNSAITSGGNSFGMGYGWRTNYNQLVYKYSTNSDYYVWEDEDGTDHYFKKTNITGTYKDEDNLDLTLKKTTSGYTITDKDENVRYFDTQGRLYKCENNQETKSTITIEYESGNQIKLIKDGVNREYRFTYTNNLLTRIGYYGNGDTELAHVAYGYDANNNLVSITDKDGKTASYSYTGYLLETAQDIDGYKLTYSYTQTEAGKPSRIETISESHNEAQGSSLTLTYAHNQTTLEDHNHNKNNLQFNDWGNTVSVQDDLGRAQHARYTNMSVSDTGKANQLRLSSKLQNTVKNYFTDSSFEAKTVGGSGNVAFVDNIAYMGNKSLRAAATISTGSVSVPAGESYTLSAWVKTENTTAKLTIGTAESAVLDQNTDWTRLEVTYDNKGQSAVTIVPKLVTEGTGYAYMDCTQLEKMPTASRYNLIDNGDFSNGLTCWSGEDYSLTTSTSGAPQLDNHMVTVTGDHDETRKLTQTIQVSGETGDCFVLAGWAKGDSIPLVPEWLITRTFGVEVTFNYNTTVYNQKKQQISFSPDTDSWQYAAAPIVAEGAYSSITVTITYDYNANTVYFDGIQLFKEVYGCSYTYNDNGDVVTATDLQNQTTTYEYNANGDLTKVILASGAEMAYTYDSYRNVLTSTSFEGLSYAFTYDTYGNNTKVSTTSDGLTISAEVTYDENGNYQTSATDALGNTVTYSYNNQTGVLEWVKGPTDTDATRTNYTYDTMYRTATETMTTDTGLSMSVGYTYENDYLTAITTPTTTYGYTYGDFGLNETVTLGGRTLVTRSYTDDRNYYLERLDFGNGHHVQYNYDNYGRLLVETYENNDRVAYQYDNDGALAAVYDSASGITTRQYYDLTGRNVGYSETGDELNHRVTYEYNNKNNLVQLAETIGTDKKVTSYTYDDDNRVTSITTDGTTVEYTYDGFGRVTQQVTKVGETVVLTEYFTYSAGENANTTTGQIATYRTVATGLDITYSYTYDANGNITAVSDGTNTTTYSYDSANQLIREDNQAKGKSYTWTYDNAGNILSAKSYVYTTGELGAATDSVPYTYGASIWKDLLTAYNGTSIGYDAIGNPLVHGTTRYTWEHGRQLATMLKNGVIWNYTYNTAGLRTGRTDGTTTYKYIYNGGQLMQMTKDGQAVYFTYDASGTPLTMKAGENTYYYVTNIQGDVMALVGSNGQTVVSYAYTAYGVVTATGDATVIALNPLTYRGYVYDSETGLYYLQSRYYDPTIGRFINADVYTSTGQGFVGNNMFAYCGNNPIMGYDPCGTCIHRWDFWNDCEACGGKTIGDKWDDFTDWCGDTFGAGVVLANSYDCVSTDTLFGGVESGVSTSETIAGDINKPISVYVQLASVWWKVTEYKIGVQVNIGDGGVCFATGVGETTASASFGNGYTLEGMCGIDKIGLTLSSGSDFGAHTAEQYTQAYIRTIPTIGVALGLLYASNATIAVLAVTASCMV